MQKRTKQPRLKLGNFYIIDYDDHFEASRATSNDPALLQPIVIRTVGRLVAITPKQYNLEYSCQVADSPGYIHSIHGIMRSCVINVTDLGKVC